MKPQAMFLGRTGVLSTVLGIALSAAPLSWAQVTPTQVSPSNATGIESFSTYGGVRENINLATGNLNLQIPLVRLPGRNGLDLSVGLEYDSKIWQVVTDCDPFYGCTSYFDYEQRTPSAGFGWRLTVPSLDTYEWNKPGTQPKYCTKFIVTFADGSKHTFPNMMDCWHLSTDGSQIIMDPQMDIAVGTSQDPDFLLLDTSSHSNIVLRGKDGTQIHFSGSFGFANEIQSVVASKIVDTNGNKITIASAGASQWNVTDTVGRVANVNLGCPGSVSYKDSTGTSRTISITCTSVLINGNPPGTSWGTVSLPGTITLPNGLTHTFQYNSSGEITKVTYPTGGYTRYDYGTFPAGAGDFREVTAKHVCRQASGSCGTEDNTTYTPTIDSTKPNNVYVDILDPLGNKTRHQFSLGQNASPSGAYIGPRELFRWVYQGTATLLRTVQTDYTLDGLGKIMTTSVPIRSTTTLNDANQVTKVEWDYGLNANVIEQREFGFGAGTPPATPIRKTTYTWLAVNSVNGQDYTSSSIHILDRKATEIVKDGAGNIVAQSQFEYDKYDSSANHAPLQASGAVQHESAYGTSYTTRGKITAV